MVTCFSKGFLLAEGSGEFAPWLLFSIHLLTQSQRMWKAGWMAFTQTFPVDLFQEVRTPLVSGVIDVSGRSTLLGGLAVLVILSLVLHFIVFILCHPWWGLLLDCHLHLPWARKWDSPEWPWLPSLDSLLRWWTQERKSTPWRRDIDLSLGSKHPRILSRQHGILWRILTVHQWEDPQREAEVYGKGYHLLGLL